MALRATAFDTFQGIFIEFALVRLRYRYGASIDDIRPAADRMRSGSAFDLVANGFWTPRLDTITLQFVTGTTVGNVKRGV